MIVYYIYYKWEYNVNLDSYSGSKGMQRLPRFQDMEEVTLTIIDAWFSV